MIKLDELIAASRQLTAREKRQLITAVVDSLATGPSSEASTVEAKANDSVRVVSDIRDLVAPFWPEDETADALIEFVNSERDNDRHADL